ncbi:hypothetical protein J6590_070442 [Homalodisca vitripennis]|nr:hypothetical protein J6590_070442 [Homalodisca vitripennis]
MFSVGVRNNWESGVRKTPLGFGNSHTTVTTDHVGRTGDFLYRLLVCTESYVSVKRKYPVQIFDGAEVVRSWGYLSMAAIYFRNDCQPLDTFSTTQALLASVNVLNHNSSLDLLYVVNTFTAGLGTGWLSHYLVVDHQGVHLLKRATMYEKPWVTTSQYVWEFLVMLL